MPDNERLVELARHGTTLVLFLSVRRPRELQAELLDGGYAADAPCAVVYRASWPDELVIRCRLDELATQIREAKITTQALVIVGPALAQTGDAELRSHVYDAGYGHRFRPLGRPDRYRSSNGRDERSSRAQPPRQRPQGRDRQAAQGLDDRDLLGRRREGGVPAAARRRGARRGRDPAGQGPAAGAL